MSEESQGSYAGQSESYVMACLAQGRWQRALELIEELGAHAAYGPLLVACGERVLAGREAETALRLAAAAIDCGAGAGAWRLIGKTRRALGDTAGAESALEQAIAAGGGEIGARLELASLLLEQSRLEAAWPLLEEALELEPASETGRELLKRLRKTAEKALPPDDPAREAMRRLAARLHAAAARPAEGPVTLALCLIVRNEARNLPRVVRSVRGLATELVVVDTGSTDNTLQLARRLDARIGRFTWVDDFAAARNHSLSLATADWVLVLDADDELDAAAAPALRSWLARAGEEVSVVGLYRRYPSAKMEHDSISIQPRLFRNGRGIRFEGAVHEQVVLESGEPALPNTVLPLTIYHHTGAGPAAGAPDRKERNRRILAKSLEANPEDHPSRFYLALTCFEAGDWSEAAEGFRQVIAGAPERSDFLPKAYACLGNALLELKRPVPAEEAVREGLARFPVHPELWFCLGMVLTALGRLEAAAEAHEKALIGRFGPSPNWHDWACRESKPHLALCDLRLSLGDPEACARHLRAAERLTGPRPAYAEIREAIRKTAEQQAAERLLYEAEKSECESDFAAGSDVSGLRLVELMLRAGEVGAAAERAREWAARAGAGPLGRVAVGRVCLAEASPAEALEAFRAARANDPYCAPAWQGEADALDALGSPEEAESALLRAHTLNDEGADTAGALGELYLAQGRWEDAARSFRSSVEREDGLWPSWLGLGRALLRSGNLPVAVNCFQKAATLSSGSTQVRRALGEARAYLTQAGT